MWVEDSMARLAQGLGFVDSAKLPIGQSGLVYADRAMSPRSSTGK